MKKYILLSSLTLTLAACGEQPADQASVDSNKVSQQASSKLNAFISKEKICDVLPVAKIKSMFKIEGAVKASVSEYSRDPSCTYTWEPKDRETKEAAMMNDMMAIAQGKMQPKSLRERAIDHEITITLKESNRTAANFVPPKLTQEQLDAQIKSAQKMAEDRLTDEQKKVAGGAANDMMANLLKKNNQNEEVVSVGDAAYWSQVGAGGLHVLDGDVQVYIAPLITSSEEVDKDYAKQIFHTLMVQ